MLEPLDLLMDMLSSSGNDSICSKTLSSTIISILSFDGYLNAIVSSKIVSYAPSVHAISDNRTV